MELKGKGFVVCYSVAAQPCVFTKYLVYSIVIISGSMLLIFDQPALIILLVKLLGIYFKNLFICIDEFILPLPDNLKS